MNHAATDLDTRDTIPAPALDAPTMPPPASWYALVGAEESLAGNYDPPCDDIDRAEYDEAFFEIELVRGAD